MEKLQTLHKKISLTLTLAMLWVNMPIYAFAAGGYNELHSKSLALNDQMTLHQGVYYNKANESKTTENYLVYKPGEAITPFISYGNDVHGAAGISRIYEIEQAAGRHIVAATNGDYFTMATGVSLGAVIRDGIVRTGEHSRHESIGFKADGTAVIGRMGLTVRVQNEQSGQGFENTGFNKVLTKDNGVILYTSDFGPANEASFPTKNVMIRVADGKAVPGGIIEGVVLGTADALAKTAIHKGEMLLSVAANTPYASALNILGAMKAGDEITVEFRVNPDWLDVQQAVGAERRLITSSTVETFTDTTRAPRTAFGVRSDGSSILYTVDGRQNAHSMGLTYAELAARLKDLGCRDAVNLDGGDSTMMFATMPGYDERSQVNKNSGASLRRCGNYILFENNKSPSKTMRHLHPYPHDVLVLAGSSVSFDVRASDANYYAVAVPATGISFQVDDKALGSITNGGVFTAGSKKTTGTITARSGSASGSARVSVIAAPDSVMLMLKDAEAEAPKQLSVPAGESVSFVAKAMYNMLELVADATAFTWTCDASIGTVDASGVFTATTTGVGTGVLSASAGDKSASIELKVTTEGAAIETFENSKDLIFETGQHGDVTAELVRNPAFVHNGRQSLALSYAYDARNTADDGSEPVDRTEPALTVPMRTAFSKKSPTMMSAWVYGSGQAETLMLDVLADGTRTSVALAKLDTTGWVHATAQLPKGVTHLLGLSIQPIEDGRGSGTLYVDQWMAGFGFYLDETAPAIEVAAADGVLNGTIADDMDTELSQESITVTYDGDPVVFSYDSSTRTLTATLPEGDGYAHRVLIRAVDESGNTGQFGLFLEIDAPSEDFVKQAAFADMKSTHWATPYAEYLYRQEIIMGRLSGKKRVYDPDQTMTRQEFAAVITRWLDVDTAVYSEGKLSFSDASKIQDWAKDSVKAAVALGYMAGKAVSGTDTVNFDPTGPISRQEVMTVIGRIQEKG